ncbi:MAG: FAD-dependent oxidoreductase [Gemmatimonadetes bacterium]|nr:FAD-dependent oxidoreductase [Gemmatimonadota bacterium]
MIRRDPQGAAAATYDLAILGGGVYGVALALEAARRGLRPVLLERGDFGGETSANSLRIVHGGLRYLQSLDLKRFRESVAERHWFLRNFPDQVRPMPCLMPLYGDGAKRPSVFRAALAANDWLSRGRNRDVRADRKLPPGDVFDRTETLRSYPAAVADGLVGGALWYDAVMPNSERLLMEMLRWAVACGAVALNYTEATGLLDRHGRTAGVHAVDRTDGKELEFRAETVVNCAGPWCRELASAFDRDRPDLFHASLAMNIVLDRPPPSPIALALTARRPGAQTLFLHPWKGHLFAGTYHSRWKAGWSPEVAPPEAMGHFLAALNETLPGLKATPDDVLDVRWGRLPAAAEDTADLAVRPRIVHHGAEGGPAGLFSVSGVKFTTARRVAEETLGVILGTLPAYGSTPRPLQRDVPDAVEFAQWIEQAPAAAADCIRTLMEEESVVKADDLLRRRTDWGAAPNRPAELGAAILEVLELHGREKAS